jgi:hypothetical protein
MRYILSVGLVVAAAGCGRAYDFSGPAPPGALRCSLAHATGAGYELIEGEAGGTELRLVQPIPPPPADEFPPLPQAPIARRSDIDRPVENQLIIRVEDGRLRLSVIGVTDAGVRVGPGSNAEDQARTILAFCSSAPPVFPDGSTESPENGARDGG